MIVCVQVPSVTTAQAFANLHFFHSENGVLRDRTSLRDFATKTICATVDSLSPFVVGQALVPTAANVTVGGRVTTADGKGINKVTVSIADSSGVIPIHPHERVRLLPFRRGAGGTDFHYLGESQEVRVLAGYDLTGRRCR